jgi:hypothetical protein
VILEGFIQYRLLVMQGLSIYKVFGTEAQVVGGNAAVANLHVWRLPATESVRPVAVEVLRLRSRQGTRVPLAEVATPSSGTDKARSSDLWQSVRTGFSSVQRS